MKSGDPGGLLKNSGVSARVFQQPARLSVALMLAFIALPLASLAQSAISITVTNITEDFGNINTNMFEKQVREMGISQGDDLLVSYGDKSLTVRFATTYSDVPRGEWVAFITDFGNLRLARNLENAAKTLGVKEGDRITIELETDR